MALASIPISPTASFAGCARGIETTASVTVLVLHDGRRLAVHARPDPAGARRCHDAMRHLSSVRIEGTVDRPSARVRGIGNRLPVDLAVPLATALALVDAGVPAVVSLLPEAVTA